MRRVKDLLMRLQRDPLERHNLRNVALYIRNHVEYVQHRREGWRGMRGKVDSRISSMLRQEFLEMAKAAETSPNLSPNMKEKVATWTDGSWINHDAQSAY